MGRGFFRLSPRRAGPQPQYRDSFARKLGERGRALRDEKRRVVIAGGDAGRITQIDAELLEIKRQLRDGPQLKAGDCLQSRYRLVEKLGSGGFATVWKAWDEERHEPVAVKVLHGQFSESAERRARFARGARAMRKLAHPHIVRLLEDVNQDGGFHFFVMEFLGGGTFQQAVLAKKLDVGRRLKVIDTVGAALAYAHGQGAIHRDVTPDNILLEEESRTAKLTDFDLVRVADSTGGTRTGALGKYIYAAPETLESGHDVDQRCDVFSLGMTALFALFGAKLPHKAFVHPETFIDALDCAEPLKPVLKRAVAHERDERTPSIAEFCEQLRRAADDVVATKPPSKSRRGTRQTIADVTWIALPAATFWMGAQTLDPNGRNHDEPAYNDESPVHKVRLKAFEMASFPVTAAQYAQFIKAGGYADKSLWIGGGFQRFKAPHDWERQQEHGDRPVVGVSWHEAAAYAKWAGCRLPTEAEWERAARGTEGRLWPWGTKPPDDTLMNFESGVGHPTPAGLYPAGATPEGIEDMSGNVWEWCSDWFDGYSSEDVENPCGPESGEFRVLRGGSWDVQARLCRCSYRGRDLPEDRNDDVGFRLVRV